VGGRLGSHLESVGSGLTDRCTALAGLRFSYLTFPLDLFLYPACCLLLLCIFEVKYNFLGMGDVPELKDANFFSYVASSPVPVAVAFYTRSSKPAMEELATFKELAGEYDGVVNFSVIDAEENPVVVDYYGILTVPTIVLFNKQKVVDRIVGLTSREALAERLEENLRKLV